MSVLNRQRHGPEDRAAGRPWQSALILAILILAALALTGCPSKSDDEAQRLTPAERDAAIVAIANRYAESSDLEAAQIALEALTLPNPSQSVLALAEAYIAQNNGEPATDNLVALAHALGPLSRMASNYLAQAQAVAQPGQEATTAGAVVQAPTDTPAPPTDTPTPLPPTDTPEPTATATDTAEPTATPTDTPEPQPRVVADSQGLNVRGGPGTLYPVVGQLQQGDEAEILARNDDGSWWQVVLSNGQEGWVYADLVTAAGPAEAVAVAQNIAPPPATPTPAATATPTVPPKPAGPPYAFSSYRLRSVGEHAQNCTGGDHNIFVKVVDPGGNPIDGVRVREIYTGEIRVTGTDGSGPGQVHYDIYRGGGGTVELVDDANNPISPQSPGMSADWPPFDLMLAAGYCNCKPHPNAESCRAELEGKQYFFAVGHYVYEVVFQRQF